jgi:hypothetical protein
MEKEENGAIIHGPEMDKKPCKGDKHMAKCKRSYSNEHSYEPCGSGKIKCVHCGHKAKQRKAK